MEEPGSEVKGFLVAERDAPPLLVETAEFSDFLGVGDGQVHGASLAQCVVPRAWRCGYASPPTSRLLSRFNGIEGGLSSLALYMPIQAYGDYLTRKRISTFSERANQRQA